eukprot:13809935-Alexandrium_andersonii.AAC.1
MLAAAWKEDSRKGGRCRVRNLPTLQPARSDREPCRPARIKEPCGRKLAADPQQSTRPPTPMEVVPTGT